MGAESARLLEWVRASPWLMQALQFARELGLRDWAIGAGSLRNLVWDALHGHPLDRLPADVDLVFFDSDEPRSDAELQALLNQRCPGLPWEVTNQARVHEWFEVEFGHAVAPLHSLEEAVASWPEFCTALAVRLEPDDALKLIAPLGLDDLFACRVRRNPRRVSVDTYRKRCASKRYAERWPKVSVLPP
ncbi:hypothetical protein HNQ51_000515 [Inhella inkyongensis]|uniref:Nucleotidyltransferase family protein n=1 Tax=Inhella inkyongensis TaxID=392593 RepID=A0A840S128_9BURK|nr:nucleotidyltransferase family protein [Inhella inkyongensis]MBB5203222.1 hypothetical protein [Inhella inkyongensis]